MNYDILVLAVSFFNLIVALALLYFLAKNHGAIRDLSNEKYKHLDRYFGDLLERIQRIERNHPVQAMANIGAGARERLEPGSNRIKYVLEKLRHGNHPDEVCREYGYSKSERGLIMASAGLAAGSAKNT
jgi:hypothetical protein